MRDRNAVRGRREMGERGLRLNRGAGLPLFYPEASTSLAAAGMRVLVWLPDESKALVDALLLHG
jgi:hypothetical protein